ncbi:MAG: hypothetical protein HKN39_00055 [Flavobacteriales bacterium]|nr:hypothetical protein [Flavobacteriales bacterium]
MIIQIKYLDLKKVLLILLLTANNLFAFAQEPDTLVQADTLSMQNFLSDSLAIEEKTEEKQIEIPQTEQTGSNATDTLAKKINRGIEVLFAKASIEPKQGEILSNVLKIINHNEIEKVVLPEFNFPATWKLIGKTDVWYEISPKDTVYIPVRIIPQKLSNGHSNYQINAFIYNSKGIQILTDHFNCTTDKNAEWKVTSNKNKIYFKNGQSEEDISFNIENKSLFDQEIFMNVNSAKGDISLEKDKIELENGDSQTLELSSYADTTFEYTAVINNNRRNFRKVSLLGHVPNRKSQRRQYSVFLNSQESKILGNTSHRNGSKIDLIKLPNVMRASDYSSRDLPLDVQMDYQNALGDFPFLSMNLNGYKNFNNDASLNYFTQLNYNQVFWNKEHLNNLPWYLGYFSNKWSAQAGNVNGGVVGMPSAGKGIKGDYQINPDHKVGAFLTSTRGFMKFGQTDAYGLNYQYNLPKDGFVLAKFGRYTNGFNGTSGNVLSLQSSLRIKEKHGVGIFGALSSRRHIYIGTLTGQQGFLLGLNYNSRFLENKLYVYVGARYNSKFFGSSNSRIATGNAKVQYAISDNWSAYYSANYANVETFTPSTGFFDPFSSYDFLQNRFVFTTNNRWGTFNPGIYYNVNNFYQYNVHARGLSLRFSKLDYIKNTLLSFYSEAGYTNSLTDPSVKDYFNFRMNTFYRLRTLTLTANYRYGANNRSAQEFQTATSRSPQIGRFSANHQYLFADEHWVLENNISYTYNNRFKSQFLGVFPEIFFFSNNGWRYSLNPGYNLNVTKYNNELLNIYSNNPINTDDLGSTVTKGFRVNVSVRKSFGVPIPFMEHKNSNVSFNVFYDLNGNDKQDKGESSIENVVLRLEDKEVLSNSKGFAMIENTINDNYQFVTFPLEELNGWFGKTPDSLSIMTNTIVQVPFVRGVKVIGNVVLNRQDIAVTDDRPFDLSNIRIAANDGTTAISTLTNFDGSFELYLPNGSYVLTIDENILGSKYSLLQNNIEVELNSDMENIYTSFFIVEKERKVKIKKFGEGGTIIRSKDR